MIVEICKAYLQQIPSVSQVAPILLVPLCDFKKYRHELVYDKTKDNYIPFVSKHY
jgi:hypothetical protein